MKRLLIGLVIVLAACGGGQSGWTAEQESEFMNWCVDNVGGSHEACACVFGVTEKHLSYDERFTADVDLTPYLDAECGHLKEAA